MLVDRNPGFCVITGKTVSQIIDGNEGKILDAVEESYLAHLNGDTVNPDSYFLRFPDNDSARIIALPAHLASGKQRANGVSGIKWIASYPENIKSNLPRASAVLILNNSETGYPYACLEASIISAIRTAASAVSGAKQLYGTHRNIDTLSIIGTGLIARFVLQMFFNTGWSIGKLVLHDLSADYADKFASRAFSEYQCEAEIVASPEEAIKRSSVILFTTTSSKPYVNNVEVFSHNPLVLNLSLRDLSAEIILSSHNVVDDIGHCLKANTSPHLAEMKVGHHDFIHSTLPELLAGKKPPKNDKPIIFTPFGMGILDLAVGEFIVQEAVSKGSAVIIEDFFEELTRI